MTMRIEAVAFNIGTGAVASTVAVTGFGFRPKAVIFAAVDRAELVDTSAAGNSRRILGMAADAVGGIKNRGAGVFDEHGIAVPGQRAQGRNHNASCLVRTRSDSGDNGRAKVTSFDADGFTLTIETAFGADMRIIAWGVGGSDITGVQILSWVQPIAGTVPFDVDLTGLGFNPADNTSVAFFMGHASPTENGGHADSDMFFGAFTSATQQFAWTGGMDSVKATSTQCQRHLKSGQLHANFNQGLTSTDRRTTGKQWITDGIRVTVDEYSAEATIVYILVINGGQWAVKTATTATGLSDVVLASLGTGTPAGGLLLSHLTTESGTDTQQNDDGWSFGAFGPTHQYALGHFGKHGVATSASANAIEHDNVYININEAGTILGSMALQTRDADGVTFHMTDADPSGNFFGAVIGGPYNVDALVAPLGLELLITVPPGITGLDPRLTPQSTLLHLKVGQALVLIASSPDGSVDASFTAESVIEASRDRHASFDRQRHPGPILLRFLDRLQRYLLGEAVQRDISFLAQEHPVLFPLADFTAGYLLPFTFHILHGGDLVMQGQRVGEFNLIPYGRRFSPVPLYSGWTMGQTLHFRGMASDWIPVDQVVLSYVPTVTRLSTITGGLTLPRSAEAAMVEHLAAFMAQRGHKDPRLPPIDITAFEATAAREEGKWLAQVGDRRRTQVKYVKDVHPYG